MKAIKFDMPSNMKSVEIIPLGDAHLGDAYADEKYFREKLRYIERTPNAYCIINGDLLNNATTSSVSDTYSETLSPMEQMIYAITMLRPIKDKIICMTLGNHERRTRKNDGVDLLRLVARELGIEDRYTDSSAVVFLRVGSYSGKHHYRQVCYSLFIHHGNGGGRKEGGKINRLLDMAEIADCDIYVGSHTHQPAVLRNMFYRTDSPTRTVTKIERLFVNTSAFLDYGSYAEQMLFKPTSKETPHIFLGGERKEFTAKL